MEDAKYEMKPVTEKRKREVKIRGRPSIYDPIIDEFIASDQDLVEITLENKKASSAAGAIQNRAKKRELDITASSVGDYVYLEKKKD